MALHPFNHGVGEDFGLYFPGHGRVGWDYCFCLGGACRASMARVPGRAAQVVPVFEDPSKWIRESLWVETEIDSDGDGRRDRVFTDVTRPGQTETEGLKVAVIYESSPYFAGTSDSKGLYWDMREYWLKELNNMFDPLGVRNRGRNDLARRAVRRALPSITAHRANRVLRSIFPYRVRTAILWEIIHLDLRNPMTQRQTDGQSDMGNYTRGRCIGAHSMAVLFPYHVRTS